MKIRPLYVFYVVGLVAFFICHSVFAVGPGNVTTGLEVWFKANTGTSTTTDATAVTTWNDQSTNVTNATATAGLQPLYYGGSHSNALNYNPTLLFDGVDDYMIHDDLNLPTGALPRSIFAVGSTSTTSGTRAIYSYGRDQNFLKISLEMPGSATMRMNNGIGLNLSASGGTLTTNVPFFAHGRISGVTDAAMDFNGLPGTRDTSSTITTQVNTADGTIGRYSGPTGSTWSGKISEVLAYDGLLDETQLQKIYSYLGLKYGITLEGLTSSGGSKLFEISNETAGSAMAPGDALGQTITATSTITFNRIGFPYWNSTGDVNAEVYVCNGQVTANTCVSTAFNTTTGLVAPVTSAANGKSFAMLTLASSATFTSGNTYTIVVKNVDTTDNMQFYLSADSEYTGGSYTINNTIFSFPNPSANDWTMSLWYTTTGIDYTGVIDYIASDGTTVMWDKDYNTSYNNDIAGIGQDDNSALDQTKSKSQNADGVMILSAATSQDNLDFLVAGNDGGAATFTTTGAPTGYGVLSRKWMTQETGETGTVTVAYDVADTGFDIPAKGTYYLVYDTDNDSSLTDEVLGVGVLQMYDNATNGDETSADSIYSLSGIDLEQGTLFTIGGVYVPLSGTVYSDRGVTNIGANITVRLLKNGVDTGLTDDTDASGYYEIDIDAATVATDDVLTVFLDNETPNGATVFHATGPNAHSGIDIYQNTIIARTETATTITNSDLDTGHNGDTDLTALYTNGGTTTLTGSSSVSLYIWAGDTYTPGGTVTMSTTSGGMYVYGTVAGAANSITLGGDFFVDNSATFTHTGTLTLAGAITATFNQGDDAITSNVTVTNSSALGIVVTTNNANFPTLTTNASGKFNLGGKSLTLSGAFSNSGTILLQGTETITGLTQDIDSGTWNYIGDIDGNADTYAIKDWGATDYFNLQIGNNSIATDTNDVFNQSTGVLIAGAYTLSGGVHNTNNNSFQTAGNFAQGGSTNTFNAGTTNIIIGGSLGLTGTAPGVTTTFNAGSGSITVGTIYTQNGSGTIFNGSTGAIDINGNFTVATAGALFTASSTTTNIAGNFTHSTGTFTHNNGTVILDRATAGSQSVIGSTTFYNLTRQDTVADGTILTLALAGGATQTVVGTLTLAGNATDDLTVSTTGAAIINSTSGLYSVSNVNVLGTTSMTLQQGGVTKVPALNPSSSVNGGNTFGWFDNTVLVEFSSATAASTDEATANNFPTLLIRGTILAAETIEVAVTGGTATSGGTDYTFVTPLTITIPAGTYDGTVGTALSITAPTLNQDAIVETGGETIVFTLQNPSTNAYIGDSNSNTTTQTTHTYTITDDDVSITVEFSSATASSTGESTANNFPKLLVNGTLASAATVEVATTGGTATGGGTDYTFSSPLTVTIPAGVYDGTTTTALTITAPSLVDDAIVEIGGETISFILQNATGVSIGDANTNSTTQSTHTYTITDDDTLLVEFTVSTLSGSEGTATPAITLTVGGATISSSVTVEVANAGSGTATSGGTDFTFATPVTITIPAGNYTTASTVALTGLTIVDDAVVESTETIDFVLQNPSGVTIGDADGNTTIENTHIYSITDNETVGVTVELSSATASSGAETAGSAPNFPTLLVNGTLLSSSTVVIDTTGGTATSGGTDYTYTDPLTITIPAGVYDGTTATDIVFTAPTIVSDSVVEGNETITFSLTTAGANVTIGDANADTVSQSTHTYTITDDDILLVEFTTTTPSASEATASPSWTLTVGGATITSSASIQVVNLGTGSATSGGTDFTFATPVTITIPAGNYTTASTITITGLTIVEDIISEVGGEDIDVDLQNASGVTEGDADGNLTIENTATFTITDNDSPAVVITESAGSTAITEGGVTDTYTISLATTPSASVSITLTPDIECTVSPVGPLVFTTTTAQTVTVTAVDDGDTEGAHTCTIDHMATSLDIDYNAIVIADVVAAVTDNDTPAVIVAGTPVVVKEADPNTAQTTDTFTVALATAPASDVNIVLTLSNGYIDLTDTDETNLASITLTFTPLNYATPQTVTVTPIDDTLYNGARSTDVSFAATSLDGNYNSIVVSDLAVTVNDGDDEDGDGVDNSVEAANSFNSGDGNGDGIQDSDQQSVSGAPNPVTGDYTTLQASGACVFITENAFIAESSLSADDASFEYPVGLVDFQVDCPGPGMSSNVTIFYTENYDVSDWTYKKYDSLGNVYADISGIVTFGTAVVGTDTVTTVAFTVTDGDPLTDEDGVADNFINDPSGPAVPVATSSGSSGSIRRICTDPTATNYAGAGARGRSVPSLCRYEESAPRELASLLDLIGGGEPNVPAEFSDYVCERYLKAYIMQGKVNDPVEVRKLQEFLNLSEGEALVVDGVYDAPDIAAINRFQVKYADQILAPWGIEEPTGNVYRTTTAKINIMLCSTQKGCPYFNEYLKEGNESIEAVKVQDFINIIFAPISGYPTAGIPLSKTFGPKTGAGVKEFQTVYKDIVLKPWGLTTATGYWYKTTRHAANKLLNCDEGSVTLDNGTIIGL